jgi:hypothetical protein
LIPDMILIDSAAIRVPAAINNVNAVNSVSLSKYRMYPPLMSLRFNEFPLFLLFVRLFDLI